MQEESLLKRIFYNLALVIPDEWYVKLKYRKNLGKWPNLSKPKTFNEKICWLRLHDHNPRYTMLVDKYEVKKHVASIIGEEHIIPTLGVWERAEDIDFDSLPNQFVMKCNHDSGRIIICKDKSSLDTEWARREMSKSLKRNFYAITREWPYKNVRRKIIAEKYMVDESGEELKDYKFFCFDGKVEFCKVDFNRFVGHRANYYDPVWSLLPFGEQAFIPDFSKEIKRPENLDKMISFAQTLAKDIPFARIDLYNIKGRTYFGEITFFPSGGMGAFTPIETDEEIGKLLKLPNGGGYIIDNQLYIVYLHPDFSIKQELTDYKFFCFDGEPKLCQVISERSTEEKIDFYDLDWNRIEGLVGLNPRVSNSNVKHRKPKSFNKMKEIARRLSAGIHFSRIDLYEINDNCYFGEITFYPAGGMGHFRPDRWNEIIGDWIQLPQCIYC